jgi:hypothetical protein
MKDKDDIKAITAIFAAYHTHRASLPDSIDAIAELLEAAAQEGYQKGFDKGYDDGFEEGYDYMGAPPELPDAGGTDR